MKRINLEIFGKDKYIIEEKELTNVLSYIKHLESKIDNTIEYIENNINKLKEEHDYIVLGKKEIYYMLNELRRR